MLGHKEEPVPDLDTPITTTEQLQERIEAVLPERLQRERDKFKDYEELKTFKSEAASTLDQAKARIAELEGQVNTLNGSLTQKEIDVERARIAAAKKVPEKWISGSTKEELEKSADEWLTDAKAVSKPGHIPGQGTGDPKVGTSSYEAGRERGEARYRKNT